MLLAGCAPETEPILATPTALSAPGDVRLLTPGDGTVSYGEVLHISGSAQNLPADGFELSLTTADGLTLARTKVRPAGADWALTLAHGYQGDPVEVTLSARAADPTLEALYDSQILQLAPFEQRPDGPQAGITFPDGDVTVGGDVIDVRGYAYGVPNGRLYITLEDEGEVISEHILQRPEQAFYDERPFVVSLPTRGHTGPAQLRLAIDDPETASRLTLAIVNAMLSVVAG